MVFLLRLLACSWWHQSLLLQASAVAITLFLLSSASWAHKASDAYLQIQESQVKISVAVKDVDLALDQLDADGNRDVTWGEIKAALPAIALHLDQHAAIRCDGEEAASATSWRYEALEKRSDGHYLRFSNVSPTTFCVGKPLAIRYSFLLGLDPTHRLIVSGERNGLPVAFVIKPQDKAAISLATDPKGLGLATAKRFFPEGVHHLLTGYDHIAFLLALLLPISLRRKAALAEGEHGLSFLLTTITAFTIGHSITLALAALEIIPSPSWIEPVIALSIAVSALLNLFPVRYVRGDVIALGFGMIHGLGFSNVMYEAGVSAKLLPWALLGFNLGIEAGQLIALAIWCVIYLVVSRWKHYKRVFVQGGSCALVVVAVFWFVRRIV